MDYEIIKYNNRVSDRDIQIVSEIYEEAFSDDEKFGTLEYLINKTRLDSRFCLYIMYAEPLEKGKKEVVAFSYHFEEEEFIYCIFIAIKKEFRSKGYGNKLISQFKQKLTEGMNYIFLAEMVEDTAANKEQRIKRKSFYNKLGFFEVENNIEFNDVHYDFYSLNKVTVEQIEHYLEKVYKAIMQ